MNPLPVWSGRSFTTMGIFRVLEDGALNSDVEIDDLVIIHINFSVEIKIAIEPACGGQRDVEVDLAVIVDVNLAVEGCVAAIGKLDQHAGGIDGLPAEQSGLA